MKKQDPARYDAVVVGAGPTGSFCALALAKQGARVALLEANPQASGRLAGEWLHPPAVRALREVGIQLEEAAPDCITGQGFVVFPEDGSPPIRLPYADGSRGIACEHRVIVAALRDAVAGNPQIDLELNARVTSVSEGRVEISQNGASRFIEAERIVGADGRSSIVRRSLHLDSHKWSCSTMIGLGLPDVELPFEGYGHVVCGGPGPMLMYRVGSKQVRILLDLPGHWSGIEPWLDSLSAPPPGSPVGGIWAACLDALREKRFTAAANRVAPRLAFGAGQRVLVGDAVGHYHPLTASGMTLGFGDVQALTRNPDLPRFAARRARSARGTELLAMGIYEVFADKRGESVALRRAMFDRWRRSPGARKQTMRMLACEDSSVAHLGMTFSITALQALFRLIPFSRERAAWSRAGESFVSLFGRLYWLVRGFAAQRLHFAYSTGRALSFFERAFLVSMQPKPTEGALEAQAESPKTPGALAEPPQAAENHIEEPPANIRTKPAETGASQPTA